MREKESHFDIAEELVLRVCGVFAMGRGRLYGSVSTRGSVGYASVKGKMVGLLKKTGMME